MPIETKAWSLFDFGDGKKEPSVLSATKLDLTQTQSVTSDVVSTESANPSKDRRIDRELTSERDAFTNTYVNKDGTKTLKYSSTQRNYNDDGKWLEIDNTLEAVQLAKPKTFFDFMAGTEPTEIKSNEYKGKAGVIETTMGPLKDGLLLNFEDKSLKLTPSGVSDVNPTKKDERTIIYKDAWPGVDIEYELRGEVVKEVIVINEKISKTEFNFAIDGGEIINHPTRKGELAIKGVDPEKYSFSSLTLDVYGRGVISEERVTQEPTESGIKVKMDSEWLAEQPASAFPMRIDPSFYRYNDIGNMYKSDGYSCNQTNCHFNTGAINDNGWKYWRTYFQFNYSNLSGGKKVLAASLQMPMAGGIGGDTGNRNMWMGYANCSGFHCVGGQPIAYAPVVGTWANFNITDVLQARVNANDFNSKFGIWGEEGTIHTYKPFYEMHIDVIYDTPTPQTSVIEPVDKQVTVSTQPTLRVQPVTDADGEPVEYYYRVSTSSDAESGAVINSGWIPGTQWTIPEGILQDGTTYYWHTYTRGTSSTGTTTVPNWVRSFKVDLRTGKDSTQAYDEVGPVGVDLATGNLTTSTATHSTNALGGSIGLAMNYNTPTEAKYGLRGEYWNVAQNYSFSSGVPTGAPKLIREDQDINFNWKTGSPQSGVVNSDWFYVRWKGYFVVPTTGDYKFGTYRDDHSKITVDGQNLTGGCYGWSPCYGSSINLQAGDVVPIDIQYQEATGDANVAVYVKGAVDEQVLPRDWLRAEPKASVAQYGLTGRYYTYTGTNPTFPTNSNDPSRLMMVRNDSKIAFNWGAAGPASGLQSDKFMTKWTGYITVPTSGSYTLGATTDDGARIKLNNGFLGAEQTVLDSWQDQAATVWGSSTNLTANQQIPITVEYFENGGGAQFTLRVKDTNDVDQEMPVKWLTPKAAALPDAWRLGLDAGGNANYERLRVAGSNVILEDSTRASHEYTWTGSGFKPPVNEDGNLVRNNDNTYTLIDTDGRTYIFDAEGNLTSLTAPSDDRNPAGLKYEYSGDPSRLTKIVDGVTDTRYGSLHYKSVNEDGNCTVPGGFDAAPDGMLCAFKTSDGDLTKLYFKAGQLSRVERPGGEMVDFGYDTLGRISSMRDSVANDAISAGVRADDASVTTELSYDEIGRVSSVKAPAPEQGGDRSERIYDYVSQTKKLSTIADLGQPVAGTTVAISWGGTRIDLFARGTGNDVLHKWSNDGITWTAWESLGGCIREKPAVSSWAKGRLDIFAQGCNDTGNNFYHKWFGGQWSNWELGPSLPSITRFQGSPSAVSWSEGRIDYVVRGTNNKLYHGWYASGWGTPETWTSCLSGSPTISSPGSGDLDIYTVGCESTADKVVSKKTYRQNAGGWSALTATGLSAVSVQASSINYDSSTLSYRKSNQQSFIKFVDSTEKIDDCGSGEASVVSVTSAVYAFHTPCSSSTKQTKISLNGASEMHVTGAQEPSGFSSRIEYDHLLRTVKQTDVDGISSHTEWHEIKDLRLSSTDATGLKSTTIYDEDDRIADSYGPAPSSWFGQDRKPFTAYSSQVPRVSNEYDQSLSGLAVAYMEATTGSSASLNGAPLLHTTNIASDGTMSKDFGATSPIPGSSSAWGMTMTGKMRLPTTGNWSFRVFSDNGVRVWIDDKLVLDSWVNGVQRSHAGITFNNTNANSLHRVRVDYYHALGGANAVFNLYATPPGGSESANVAQYFNPNYNLTTSEVTYDSQIGDVMTATSYSKPEYGLVDKATADPTGLNLQSSSVFETPGSGFLRQTSKTLPGDGTTTYQHYSATDTRDNPCTSEVEAVHQGGLPKGKVEADPDGSGNQTARTSETIYNESGMIVATRYNNDSWTCISYDDRGRTISTVIPTIGSMSGRTITNNYAVDDDPLKTSVNDGTGAVVTTVDLLGRTVSYTDAHAKTTISTYDNLGRLATRSGPLGDESFVYDNVDKLIEQKLDGVTVSVPYYDQYGRLTSVDYPTAGQQELSGITRDSHGRTTNLTYSLGDSSTVSDTVTYSQSGMVLTNSRTVASNSLNSTYSYDKAARLTGATIGSNTYSYEFGALDASCGSGNGINPNAGKNSNRTKQTINGVSTTYCYDYADRLVGSSDQLVNAPEYDAHGNTTEIGSTSTPLSLTYDASDRNMGLEELNSSQTGKGVYYERDALDRIIERKADTITAGTHQTDSLVKYSFTGSGDTPDLLLDNAGNVKEKYVPLVGGVLLTLRPNEAVEAQKATHSLSNIHGDVFVTTDKMGNLTSAVAYDPFGNKLPGTTGTPQNTEAGSFDWVGVARKQTENNFALNVTQMGARVYVPVLGRFLQVDPAEGGTLNNYVYVVDPINQYDVNGQFAFIPLAIFAVRVFVAIAVRAAPVIVPVAVTRIAKQGAKSVGSQAVKSSASQAAKGSASRATSSAKPSAAPAPKQTQLPNMAANRQTLHVTEAYSRPSNATTAAQRLSVQSQSCVTCGSSASKMYADHKLPLVQEYYSTGAINLQRMRSLNAVQPQCPACSNAQGGQLSAYSRSMRNFLDL